jgi:SAM-dependent methyltransferase
MPLDASRRFWDDKARENAYWYVSSYGPYEGRDLTEFWASGPKIWRELCDSIGYRPRASDVVVEIGCGVGRLTRAIAADVARVEAFDLSREMLAIARQADLGNVRFHHGDGVSLRPLTAGTADCVLAYCVFQHLPSTAVLGGYLAEMLRVARPGATIAFTLTRPTWTTPLRPLLRVRQWVREPLRRDGPRGLYRRAWVGIQPRAATVRRLAPIPLHQTLLHGDKWLFHGVTPGRSGRGQRPVGSEEPSGRDAAGSSR